MAAREARRRQPGATAVQNGGGRPQSRPPGKLPQIRCQAVSPVHRMPMMDQSVPPAQSPVGATSAGAGDLVTPGRTALGESDLAGVRRRLVMTKRSRYSHVGREHRRKGWLRLLVRCQERSGDLKSDSGPSERLIPATGWQKSRRRDRKSRRGRGYRHGAVEQLEPACPAATGNDQILFVSVRSRRHLISALSDSSSLECRTPPV